MTLSPGDFAFGAMATSPLGGLLVAIPFAILKLHYPGWLALLIGVPLAYVQVVLVDLGWNALSAIPQWERLLERRRSARVERLLKAQGAFWATFVASPFLGPWLVMALMRYAQVPQRRVALPIALSLLSTAAVVWAGCALIPAAFAR